MKKLMANTILIGGTLLLLAATTAVKAGTTNNEPGMHYDQEQPRERTDLYRANEFSMDVFGTASLGQYTIEHPSGDRVRQNTEFGVGVGFNYFFCHYLGIGGDMYSENTTGVFIDSASASLILRLPLGQSGFAPYVYGGGGYLFELGDVWFAQLGGGIEYRFTPHIGTFLDARWVLPDETKYYGVARPGVRFAFLVGSHPCAEESSAGAFPFHNQVVVLWVERRKSVRPGYTP